MPSRACFLKAALTQCRTSNMWCSFGLEVTMSSNTINTTMVRTSKVEIGEQDWRLRFVGISVDGRRLSRTEPQAAFQGNWPEMWDGTSILSLYSILCSSDSQRLRRLLRRERNLSIYLGGRKIQRPKPKGSRSKERCTCREDSACCSIRMHIQGRLLYASQGWLSCRSEVRWT